MVSDFIAWSNIRAPNTSVKGAHFCGMISGSMGKGTWILVENDKAPSEDQKISHLLRHFFVQLPFNIGFP